MRRLFLFFFILCGVLEAKTELLTKKDLRNAIEEILAYHVEYKEYNEILAKRSLKIFIDQFDPYQSYFLQSEIKEYVDPSNKLLKNMVRDYQKNKYITYQNLTEKIKMSIYRARQIRAQIIASLDLKGELKEGFALTLDGLEEKIKAQMHLLILSEMEAEGLQDLSDENKKKVLKLWERRFQAKEDQYLSSELFPLHVIKANAKSLDAHTCYFSPNEAYDLRTSLEKQFEGVGFFLREGIFGVVVEGLIQGGPAERCQKIQKGDLLIAIDGDQIANLPYDVILEKLKGKNGSRIDLTLVRNGVSIEVELIRERIVMDDGRVKSKAVPFGKGIIGVIELPSFYENGNEFGSEKDLRNAILELKKQGELFGVILDMRENSGGFLSQAVKVASLFISGGVVVISKYATGEVQYLRNVNGKMIFDGPLLLLTSKASASAAEIVAQGLQDYGIALVVGDERTYGKGSFQYQTVTDQNAKSYFKVTVGKYYTVSGRSTQLEGVIADIKVPTAYAPFNIGEKYLPFALKNDQVESAYIDLLQDIPVKNRLWMEKNYIPHLQKRVSFWSEVLPILKTNSQYRLEHNKNFLSFLRVLYEDKVCLEDAKGWGVEDLQLQEALEIVKDMQYLQQVRSWSR